MEEKSKSRPGLYFLVIVILMYVYEINDVIKEDIYPKIEQIEQNIEQIEQNIEQLEQEIEWLNKPVTECQER